MRFYAPTLSQEEILKIALEQVTLSKSKEHKEHKSDRAKRASDKVQVGDRKYAVVLQRNGYTHIPIQSDDHLKIICKTAKKAKNKTNKLVRLFYTQQF